jgi:tRNA1(Val) A37 N6-methylase TrmN6
MEAESQTSEDAILGGRLRIRQPLRGHRVGHDAILLAAATAARAGELAVDLGAGVGAAGLALAARVPGLRLALVEIDPGLCALAADNARLNRLDDRTIVLGCDVADEHALSTGGLLPGGVDRVLMNPPFHDAQRHNVSPDPRRRLAYAGASGLLARWLATAARLLKPHGALTLIWRADELDGVLGALRSEFGNVAILPVLPRPGAPPVRVLVAAFKGDQGGQGGPATCEALVLNDERGHPTGAAEAVLRAGQALDITGK